MKTSIGTISTLHYKRSKSTSKLTRIRTSKNKIRTNLTHIYTLIAYNLIHLFKFLHALQFYLTPFEFEFLSLQVHL